jgi:hypothetical protein
VLPQGWPLLLLLLLQEAQLAALQAAQPHRLPEHMQPCAAELGSLLPALCHCLHCHCH